MEHLSLSEVDDTSGDLQRWPGRLLHALSPPTAGSSPVAGGRELGTNRWADRAEDGRWLDGMIPRHSILS